MAEESVKFEFSNRTMVEAELRDSMEHHINCLLNRINEAVDHAQDKLILNNINITQDAKEQLNLLWENNCFSVADDDIVEYCHALEHKDTTYSYKVTGIAIRPQSIYNSSGDSNQFLSIYLNSYGQITDVCLEIDRRKFVDFYKSLAIYSIFDSWKIIHFCEKINTAYYDKDEEYLKNFVGNHFFLEKIAIGDSVQIIEGSENYLNYLRQMWVQGKEIHFDIKELEIRRHPTKPFYYGITLKQEWRSKYFSDDGYMFVLFSLKNKEIPIVYVCAWYHGYPLDKKHIPKISSFRIN